MTNMLIFAKKTGWYEAYYRIEAAKDPWKIRPETITAQKRRMEANHQWKDVAKEVQSLLKNEEFELMKVEASNYYWMGRNEVEIPAEEKMRPLGIRMDKKAVHNLTTRDIPEDIMLVLSWGPKFVFPVEVMDETKVIPALENLIYNRFDPLMIEEAMRRASMVLKGSTRNKMKMTTDTTSWLNFIRGRTTEFFKEHKDILVLNSDKGKHTVVMYEMDYERKMSRMLEDSSTYTRTEDMTDKNIKRNQELVDKLINCGAIEKEHRYRYLDSTATTAKIYGLPKVHKKDAPLRPITSTTNAPGSNLAKRMTEILSTIFDGDDLHLKNSTQAKYYIDKVQLEEGEVLVSFDVISMFTNIPLELVRSIIGRKWREIKIRFGIDKNLLDEILVFLLADCATFTYRDTTYKQTRGLAMGSPLSPLLAKIVMTDLMEKQLPKLVEQPKLLKVYVDDTLGIVRHTDRESILSTLNGYHKDVQFTMEDENEKGELNFLDMTIRKENGTLSTNWYKKEFASDRMLNYLSGHEDQTIKATATAHIKTVINLSDGKHFQHNKEMIWKRLRLNNFPETEIMGLMNKHYTLMTPTSRTKPKERGAITYGVMPDLDVLNGQMKSALKDLQLNCRLTVRPDRANSRIMSMVKDKTAMMDQTNVILVATCNCSKRGAIERTDYQERGKEAMTRLKQKHQFGTDHCVGKKHTYNEEVTMHNGGRTYQEHLRRSITIAYTKRGIIDDPKWGLPHIKMRRYLDNKE